MARMGGSNMTITGITTTTATGDAGSTKAVFDAGFAGAAGDFARRFFR